MCSSSTSCSYLNVHVERKPTMLKDFLHENSNSFSSSGFKSSDTNPTKLQRSRSKAASTTILVFHSIMNAVKTIQFTAVKTPSFLPRSLSRRLSKRSSSSSWSRKQSSTSLQTQVQIGVKVKDILRWTSFRDEKSLPQCPPWDDCASSPHHCTTTTVTTTTTTSSNNSSNGSSWCESDFTAEFLPSPCHGGNERGKEYSSACVGSRCIELDSKVEVLSCDKDEQQHTPVSVLDYQFGEDNRATFSTSFDQSIAIVEGLFYEEEEERKFEERAMEMLNYEEEEEERKFEERAMEMLNYIKETSLTPSYVDNMEDKLLLDFFKEEMGAQRNGQTQEGFDWEIINKEGIVRELHKGGKWVSKFEDEREELAMEVESAVLEYLVDEIFG